MENAYPSVLISFFKKIKDGEPITIYGDGNQTRDFVHVYDIVEVIIKSTKAEITGAEIYNVGTGRETKILELAEKIKELNPSINTQFESARDFDIAKSCAEISKIKKDLNFEPSKNILDDLETLMILYTS
jgi:UDP-glucose 4-epimerase